MKMKIVRIENYFVIEDLTKLYSTIESARFDYPFKLIVEAPDYVFPGWIYDSKRVGDACFIKPAVPKGWAYDDETGTFYNLSPGSPNVSLKLLHSDNIEAVAELGLLYSRSEMVETLLDEMKEVINDDN